MGNALVLAAVGDRGPLPTLGSLRRRNEQYPHRQLAGGVTRVGAAAASIAFRPARSPSGARSTLVIASSDTLPRSARERIPIAAGDRPLSSAAASPCEPLAHEEDWT